MRINETKEVFVMINYEACSCENCGRTNESVQIDALTIKQHTAQLCLACAHVLSLPNNEARFLQLVRKKGVKQSNQEMQKAHRILSAFIVVGAMFLVILVAAGISQAVDFTTVASPDIGATQTDRQLTFIQLKRLD